MLSSHISGSLGNLEFLYDSIDLASTSGLYVNNFTSLSTVSMSTSSEEFSLKRKEKLCYFN